MRIVIDTNVLVSGLISNRGSIRRVLDLLRDHQYKLLYSEEILSELLRVLRHSRIRDKYQIGPEEISALFDLILMRGILVIPTVRIDVCRDPKDNKFLEVAVTGEANILVTGDDDLLSLYVFQGIRILTPAEFVTFFDPDLMI